MIDQVLEKLPDGVVVLDLAGQIQFANPAARALLGAAASHFDVPVGDTLVAGRLVACSVTPIDAGSLVVLRDITDRTIAARRAELADRRADHAIQAASLAHQINNPLAIINVHAELMKDEIESLRARHREEAKRYADISESLTEIEAAVTAITHLTSDLRAFSQPMPNARSDLRRAIDWAIRTASPALRDRAR
ncbi:MAG: histidine kinase dimerization/phospho-acceptor domain-containing protein, partial [Kofleriaceae bacterium]